MINDRVIQIIANALKCDSSLLTPETRLSEYGLDSLKVINIIFELEEEFDIELDSKVENVETIGDIITAVNEHLAISGA